jgi:mannitol/fructose-specific phosphotransferase system IIA component (Ntr-type)
MLAVTRNETNQGSSILVDIEQLVNRNTVFFMYEHSRKEVLDALCQKAVELGLVEDIGSFQSAIYAREGICSTAIGDGIAIPHARLSGISRFFVLTAIVDSAVNWDAPDQKPVNLVFLIGGPQNDQLSYLHLLGKILRSVKDQDNRMRILASVNAEEVAALFLD